MDKSQTLKKRLIELHKNNWQFPDDVDADSLAEEMVEALKSVDSDLRWRLACAGLYELINSGRISDKKCHSLFLSLINENLLHGLGREDDDSLVARTWSVLAVPDFFEYNNKMNRRILSDNELRDAFNTALKCLNEEKDLRYYVEDKGIGHAICHYTEAFPILMADSSIGKDEIMALLDAVKGRICINYQSYFTYEYVTFADTIIGVLKKEVLSEAEFTDWVESFLTQEKTGDVHKDKLLWENQSKFFWCMEARLKTDYPHLHVYVWDAIFSLMDKSQSLNVKLFELARGDWAFPDSIDAAAIADEMKEVATSADYELRDMLALSGFKKLISSGRLSDKKCHDLLSELISEKHLFQGLGKVHDNSVNNRAWSVRAIGEIISYNQRVNRRLLNDDTIRHIFGLVLKCVKEERDLRPLGDCKGYKTTAYSCHIETIGKLMEDRAIGYDEIMAALTAFKGRICTDYHTCFQCFSLPAAEVIPIVLEKGIINEKELLDWIAAFFTLEKTGDPLKGNWQYQAQSQFLWLALWFTQGKFEDKYPNFNSYVRDGALGMMEA